MQADPSYFASPRAKLLWAVVGVLVAVQMVALYKLCDGQMDRARQRQAALEQHQMAINDCLMYSPDVTIGGCMQRAAAAQAERGTTVARGANSNAVAAAAPKVLTAAMPVSFR